MARRRQAREVALQLLYQRDINPDTSLQVARESLDELLPAQELRDFSWQIYVGTTSRLAEIDEQIIEAADNWSLSRMAPTDRNVIRMGIYEMTAMETPAAVVLDECIELARDFGNAASSAFVNGVLDRLMPQDDTSPRRPVESASVSATARDADVQD